MNIPRRLLLTLAAASFAIACSEEQPRPDPEGKDAGASGDDAAQAQADAEPQNDDANVIVFPDATDPQNDDGGEQADAGENPDADNQSDAEPQGNDATTGPDAEPGPDGGGPNNGAIGAACTMNSACTGGTCLQGAQPWWDAAFAEGYCTTTSCTESSCPTGSDCFVTDEAANGTACFDSCSGPGDCRPGYACFEPGACLPDLPTNPNGAAPGAACTQNSDCAGQGAQCITDAEFPGGYCYLPGCSEQNPCPNGAECFTIDANNNTACLASCTPPGPAPCRTGYACVDAGACLPACTADSCEAGEVCGPRGVCTNAPCTATSCQNGLTCDMQSGQCVVNVGTPPPGPVPNCPNLPDWRCTGGEANCGQVVGFEPDTGPGYWDYAINGETMQNEYRSFIRRDVMMLVKHAAAGVDCLSANWSVGNDQPLGLGDMSESNGAIPGTAVGEPGHPAGTHVNGHDMDIAYYQISSPDNILRPICSHVTGGRDQYHCVATPNNLDVWRTALFIGLLHRSPQLRVIGVDGRVGPMVESAMVQLCNGGYLTGDSCTQPSLAYETTDEGRGWYHFHHHHLHISLSGLRNVRSPGPNYSGPDACLSPNCDAARHDLEPVRKLRRAKMIYPLNQSLPR